MIKVRGGYSDRNGFNPVCNIIQIDDLDDRTRVILFNKIWELVNNHFGFSRQDYITRDSQFKFAKELLVEIFGEIVNPNNIITVCSIFDKIKNVICQAPINEVWDIIEFICNKLAHVIYDGEVEFIERNALYEEEPYRNSEQKVKAFFPI